MHQNIQADILQLVGDTLSLTMEEKGQKMVEFITSYRKKREECDRLVRALEFQAQLMMRGIDPMKVRGYGYDPLMDTRRKPGLHDPHAWIDRQNGWWNVVIMKDGTRITLTEPIRRRTEH